MHRILTRPAHTSTTLVQPLPQIGDIVQAGQSGPLATIGTDQNKNEQQSQEKQYYNLVIEAAHRVNQKIPKSYSKKTLNYKTTTNHLDRLFDENNLNKSNNNINIYYSHFKNNEQQIQIQSFIQQSKQQSHLLPKQSQLNNNNNNIHIINDQLDFAAENNNNNNNINYNDSNEKQNFEQFLIKIIPIEQITYLMSNIQDRFNPKSVLIGSILVLIILVTFVGNVLVCLSVIKVRKLRKPSNYLLISLAISDLCVACIVMPFGVYIVMNTNWHLGRLLCNIYVVSDVTSCTASILNLCVISIDRYLAITRPLTYCAKRTTKLMLALIASAWICAFLISVPPLFISGNEYGTPQDPKCEVNQGLYYQLYATCMSFYIPSIVMICLYYKIYTAAKKVVEADRKILGNLHNKKEKQQHHNIKNHNQQQQQQLHNPNNPNQILNPNQNQSQLQQQQHSTLHHQQNQHYSHHSNNHQLAIQHHQFHDHDHLQPTQNHNLNITNDNNNNNQTDTMININNNNTTNNNNNNNNKTISNNKNNSISVKISNPVSSNLSSMVRERKASITLGVIMSIFTICWLPFFILALLRPFSEAIDKLPRSYVFLTLWLGYANSLLNPIIYVTFHHDFRIAFKSLLCSR